MYLCIEGIGGCGKTTQLRLLEQNLIRAGRQVVTVAEPGTTPIGLKLREILVESQAELTPENELLLFMAARNELIHHTIEPALASHKVVLADRCFISSFAYQGYAGGQMLLCKLLMGTVIPREPNFTFILDVPASVGTARRKATGRADRFTRNVAFYEKAAEGYRRYAREYPGTLVINGEQDAGTIAAEIWKKVLEKLHV